MEGKTKVALTFALYQGDQLVRRETVAQDIVRHFLGRGFVGKAMVVSIDKATALKMHDKVRKHWAAETEQVRAALGRLALPEAPREGNP